MSNHYVTHVISTLNSIFSQMENACPSMISSACFDGLINPMAVLNNNKEPEEYENVPFYVHWKDKKSKYIACNNTVAHDAGHNSVSMKGTTDLDFHFLSKSQMLCYRESDAIVRETGKAQFFFEPVTRVNGSKIITISHKSLLKVGSKVVGTKCMAFIFDQDQYADKNQKVELDSTPLSPRQIDCLYYLVKGMTTKQIANTLNLSPRTIEHYLEAIKIKWNCANKAELIVRALQLPIIKNKL